MNFRDKLEQGRERLNKTDAIIAAEMDEGYACEYFHQEPSGMSWFAAEGWQAEGFALQPFYWNKFQYRYWYRNYHQHKKDKNYRQGIV